MRKPPTRFLVALAALVASAGQRPADAGTFTTTTWVPSPTLSTPVLTVPSASSYTNLAAGRPTTQSSTALGADAARAVDGNTSGSWSVGSVTHTEYSSQPWWQVDLGEVDYVHHVTLHNRTDCCSDRLADFYVLVSETPIPVDLGAALAHPDVRAVYVASVASPSDVAVADYGRYVRVQLAGTSWLSLAEVAVVGHYRDEWRDLQPGRVRAVAAVAAPGADPVAFAALNDGELLELAYHHPAGPGEAFTRESFDAIVDLAAYDTPDGVRHVIVAEREGDISEVWFDRHGLGGRSVLASFPGVVAVTGHHAADDDRQHVFVATASGQIHEIVWQGGMGLAIQSNLIGFTEVRDIASAWVAAAGEQRLVVADRWGVWDTRIDPVGARWGQPTTDWVGGYAGTQRLGLAVRPDGWRQIVLGDAAGDLRTVWRHHAAAGFETPLGHVDGGIAGLAVAPAPDGVSARAIVGRADGQVVELVVSGWTSTAQLLARFDITGGGFVELSRSFTRQPDALLQALAAGACLDASVLDAIRTRIRAAVAGQANPAVRAFFGQPDVSLRCAGGYSFVGIWRRGERVPEIARQLGLEGKQLIRDWNSKFAIQLYPSLMLGVPDAILGGGGRFDTSFNRRPDGDVDVHAHAVDLAALTLKVSGKLAAIGSWWSFDLYLSDELTFDPAGLLTCTTYRNFDGGWELDLMKGLTYAFSLSFGSAIDGAIGVKIADGLSGVSGLFCQLLALLPPAAELMPGAAYVRTYADGTGLLVEGE